jgi:uncharacterized protein (TIGR00725 family)
MRKLQIGIIGSQELDMNKKKDEQSNDFAYQVSYGLSRLSNIFILTNGKTGISQSVIQGAKDAGTSAITINSGECYNQEENSSGIISINTTLDDIESSWPFIHSCDSLIVVGGGSITGVQMSLAVDLGLHIVVYSKAGGISSEVFTSLEPAFQKMRSSQLVFLADNPEEAMDYAKKFAMERQQKGFTADDQPKVTLPQPFGILINKRRLIILLAILKEQKLSAQSISDMTAVPTIIVEAHLKELLELDVLKTFEDLTKTNLYSINQESILGKEVHRTLTRALEI